MASKAQLQLQRVEEITQEMWSVGRQLLWTPSPELLMQMGPQARGKLEEERNLIIRQRQQPENQQIC